MVRSVLPYLGLFAAVVLLVIPVAASAEPGPKYVLVMRIPGFFGEDGTPSGALLITDPAEVKRVHALAAASTYTGHTCGFDWSLRFWSGPSELVDSYSINESCDRYDAQLKPYFRQAKEQPTHFLHNLTVPVDVQPDEVMHDLEEQGLVAFLRSTNAHLPRARLSTEVHFDPDAEEPTDVAPRAEAAVRALVEILAKGLTVEGQRVLGCSSWSISQGPEAEGTCQAMATVWFELGADLNGIEGRISATEASVQIAVPEQYDILLVTGEKDSSKVLERLSKRLHYLQAVSEYSPILPKPTPTAGPGKRQFYWMSDRSLRLDAEGNPHVAYGRDHLYYAWRDEAGWHYETADGSLVVGMSASIALDRNGLPHISYSDWLHDDLKVAYRDGSGWHAETVDSAGAVGRYTSIALDAGGLPHISYSDDTNDSLKYAYRDTSGWHSETADESCRVAWHTSLALDSAGYPHIGFYDDAYRSVKFAYQDASGWHVETVDDRVSRGGHVSVALDSADQAHLTYECGSPDDVLKYAYKDSARWYTETIDSGGFHAAYTSIALDQDGQPHVSYYHQDSGSLRYARRHASGWRVEEVDSEGGELRSTSLALDHDGHPHIAYHVWSSGEFRYASRNGSGWHVETVDREGRVGEDGSPNPAPDPAQPGSRGLVEKGCIYVGETIVLGAGNWGRYGVGTKLSSGEYGASLGAGKICWSKGGGLLSRSPFALPAPQDTEATPGGTPAEGPSCRELVTPDAIGAEDFAQFAVGEKLEEGGFQREVTQDRIACRHRRVLDSAVVEGDGLSYLFDRETGALVEELVWWRADLPAHPPAPLVTREEAEALVEGEVRDSMLVLIHPQSETFTALASGPADAGAHPAIEPPTDTPCWVVAGNLAPANGSPAARMAVVDAMSGELLGYTLGPP